jgi:hypothetical protein
MDRNGCQPRQFRRTTMTPACRFTSSILGGSMNIARFRTAAAFAWRRLAPSPERRRAGRASNRDRTPESTRPASRGLDARDRHTGRHVHQLGGAGRRARRGHRACCRAQDDRADAPRGPAARVGQRRRSVRPCRVSETFRTSRTRPQPCGNSCRSGARPIPHWIHRAAASAVSCGVVLKAMAAAGAA